MSTKRRTVVGAVILATLLLAAVAATSALAIPPPDPRILPVNTDSTDATGYHQAAVDLANSIATDPSQVTDARFVTTTPPTDSVAPDGYTDPWPYDGMQDGPLAIGTDSNGLLAGFPTNGSTYGILTTGDPWFADTANLAGDAGRSNGGDAYNGDTSQDVSILEMDMNVPSGVNCLSLDYRFLSEEFPEFVGSEFNDAFVAEVDTSNWSTSGSTISAPNDFATKTGTSGVSVNGVGPVAVSDAESSDTTYDAATGLVSTHTPITPGAHKVFLSIFDQGDQYYDSAAFVDNLHFLSEDPALCKPPEVAQAPPPPPPATPTAPAPPSNQIAGSSIKFKNGATILTVNVPGPGTVTAGPASATAAAARADAAKKKHKKHKKPALIKKTTKVATQAGPVSLTIKPTAAGKKLLKKKGKFTVKTAITFAPTGGTPATTFKNVTIKIKKKHHKKH